MNYAETLKAEMANTDQQIIDNEIMPRKDEILSTIAAGIKRIGYVCIDSLCGTSSAEGCKVGIFDNKKFPALIKFLTSEGFKVSRQWWGYSANGLPDMIKISV